MRESIPVIRLRNPSGRLAARDGVVLCFFMRRSHGEIASGVWRALQTYVRAIPRQALGWYTHPEGDILPLDDTGWEHIRKKMLERPMAAACNMDLEEDPAEAGGYNFEYRGRKLDTPIFSHDEDSTSGVAFSFPTEYLLEHGPAHLRALALELARELPFSFGYASLAFISPSGFWYSARQELLPFLSRYLGLDIYRLEETSRVIGTRARGPTGSPSWANLCSVSSVAPRPCTRSSHFPTSPSNPSTATACSSPSPSGQRPSTPRRSSTRPNTASWRACSSPSSARSAQAGSLFSTRSRCAAGCAGSASKRAGSALQRKFLSA